MTTQTTDREQISMRPAASFARPSPFATVVEKVTP